MCLLLACSLSLFENRLHRPLLNYSRLVRLFCFSSIIHSLIVLLQCLIPIQNLPFLFFTESALNQHWTTCLSSYWFIDFWWWRGWRSAFPLYYVYSYRLQIYPSSSYSPSLNVDNLHLLSLIAVFFDLSIWLSSCTLSYNNTFLSPRLF